MGRHLETEFKYDVSESFALPELTGLPGAVAADGPQVYILTADYYDTPDQRLAARGITLRRRSGGADDGWHLKIPTTGRHARLELHEPLTKQRIPAALTRAVTAITRGERLRRVATLVTRRTVVRLLDLAGEPVAEIADDTVRGTLPTDQDFAVDWREIEVEADSPDLLRAADTRLRKVGARPAAAANKLARVLPPPAPAERAALPAGSAGRAVVDYLADQVAALLAHDPLVRVAEPDAVHRMRVAVRRSRSLLWAHQRLLAGTRPLQHELKLLAADLGEVRDLEVLRIRFGAALDALPGDIGEHRDWLDALAGAEQAGYRRLDRTLTSPRYYALLDALDALLADPPLTQRAAGPAEHELTAAVARAWRRMERAYAAAATLAERHEVRKDAKRARYVAEAAVPVLGDAALATARDAELLQETMGGFQDGVIAERYLLAAAEHADPAERFTIGVLWGLEQAAAQAALRRIPQVWREVSERRAARSS